MKKEFFHRVFVIICCPLLFLIFYIIVWIYIAIFYKIFYM